MNLGLAHRKVEFTAPPKIVVSDDERLRALNALFRAGRAYWARVGSVRAHACQFVVTNDAARDFFIVVDGDGASAVRGRHAKADAQWRSDSDALDAGFRGAMLRDQVRVRGDVDALVAVMRGIGQSKI